MNEKSNNDWPTIHAAVMNDLRRSRYVCDALGTTDKNNFPIRVMQIMLRGGDSNPEVWDVMYINQAGSKEYFVFRTLWNIDVFAKALRDASDPEELLRTYQPTIEIKSGRVENTVINKLLERLDAIRVPINAAVDTVIDDGCHIEFCVGAVMAGCDVETGVRFYWNTILPVALKPIKKIIVEMLKTFRQILPAGPNGADPTVE